MSVLPNAAIIEAEIRLEAKKKESQKRKVLTRCDSLFYEMNRIKEFPKNFTGCVGVDFKNGKAAGVKILNERIV